MYVCFEYGQNNKNQYTERYGCTHAVQFVLMFLSRALSKYRKRDKVD